MVMRERAVALGLSAQAGLAGLLRWERSWARVGSSWARDLGWVFQGRLGWAWVELGEGLGWVWFSFSILFLSSFLFLIQTKFEFKYKFEFKPHSNN